MDRMTSMATFVKVVESGGFSAAARTLSMSPSMVTAHVQSLEERLGVRLLNRSTRRGSLTEVGHAYYERCLQILAEADDADQVAQAVQWTPRGTLRLNTSIAIPPLLAPVVAEFVALYPEVSVSLTMTDRMIDLVEDGSISPSATCRCRIRAWSCAALPPTASSCAARRAISPRGEFRGSRPICRSTIVWSTPIRPGATNGGSRGRMASNRSRSREICKPTATTRSG